MTNFANFRHCNCDTVSRDSHRERVRSTDTEIGELKVIHPSQSAIIAESPSSISFLGVKAIGGDTDKQGNIAKTSMKEFLKGLR